MGSFGELLARGSPSRACQTVCSEIAQERGRRSVSACHHARAAYRFSPLSPSFPSHQHFPRCPSRQRRGRLSTAAGGREATWRRRWWRRPGGPVLAAPCGRRGEVPGGGGGLLVLLLHQPVVFCSALQSLLKAQLCYFPVKVPLGGACLCFPVRVGLTLGLSFKKLFLKKKMGKLF